MKKYYPINSIKRLEPRILYIKEVLEEILKVVQLESNGEPIEIDGFRLRNLRNWIVDNPFNDSSSIYTHCARQCSANCSFCYLKGNPGDIAIGKTQEPADLAEILTRLKYYDPKKGKGLFNSTFEYRETLEYPYIKEILTQIRDNTSEPFFITTNGAVLDEDMTKFLVDMKPILLIVSIIASNYEIRKKLVGSSRDITAINSIKLLKNFGIPYIASVTMWPGISLENLEETIAYCDENNPYYIRITLPGFTKLQNFEQSPFDSEKYWFKIIHFIRNIKHKYNTPILIFPPIVEEVLFEKELNKPIIGGIIRSSPSALINLQTGDEILSINQINISNRVQARKVLSFFDSNNVKNLEIAVYRNQQEKKFTITPSLYKNHSADFKAFKRSYFYFPYGIILHSGFKETYIKDLLNLIKNSKKKNILLFSSKYIKPFVEKYLNIEDIEDINLDIVIPKSKYLGGNMVMGDMMVVSDFINSLKVYLQQKKSKPDLIVIPSSTFPQIMWHRDLRGVYYKEIEREFGIETVLLECETIMF